MKTQSPPIMAGGTFRNCLIILSLCSPALCSADLVEAWLQRYSIATTSEDRAKVAAVDPAGNVIVAGYTSTGRQGNDLLILKYSSAGVPLWTNRFNGEGDASETAAGIVCGNEGNIYIIASSRRSAPQQTLLSIRTVAYSSQGQLLWSRNFGTNDFPSALALDGAGNVYVTGWSWFNNFEQSFVTIAYATNGTPLWTNRYNELGETAEVVPNTIRVLGNGEVLVAGSSIESLFGEPDLYEYVILRYSTNGLPLSTNRFPSSNSIPYSMSLDDSGNLYVTGYVGGNNWDTDYYTAAFSSSTGVPLWTRFYGKTNSPDVAEYIAIGPSNKVIVTGRSRNGSGFEFVTIAYAMNGMPLWTNRYARDSAGFGAQRGLAINPNTGDVIVIGLDGTSGLPSGLGFVTLAYSSSGARLWTNYYGHPGPQHDFPQAVAVSSNGTVYVTGYDHITDDDFATLAYSSAGMPLWTNRHTEIGVQGSGAAAVAIDNNGNAYVLGNFVTNGTSCMLTISYSSNGTARWTNIVESAEGRDIAVNASGRIVALGRSPTGQEWDILTIAYSNLGASLWTNRYHKVAYDRDQPTAIVADTNGNVFVFGSSSNGTNYDFVTLAYSSDGTPLWTNRFGAGATEPYHTATAMCIDSNGNVYVTGNSPVENSAYLTLAYSNSGVPLWTNRFRASSMNERRAQAVVADHFGNVHVTGSLESSSFESDFVTVSYSSSGLPFATNYAAGTEWDVAAAIAIDQDGNFYVTGQSLEWIGAYSFLTVAYSSLGTPLWTNRYIMPHFYYAIPTAIVVDQLGHIIVSGSSSGTILTLVYAKDGTLLTSKVEDRPPQGKGLGWHGLATTPDSGILLAGSFNGDYSPEGNANLALLKYLIEATIRLNPVNYLPNTGFHLMIVSSPNTVFNLEASTNLSNWQPLIQLGPSVFSTLHYTDTTATAVSRRFYRAVGSP